MQHETCPLAQHCSLDCESIKPHTSNIYDDALNLLIVSHLLFGRQFTHTRLFSRCSVPNRCGNSQVWVVSENVEEEKTNSG